MNYDGPCWPFLGGEGDDFSTGLAVDPSGNSILAGVNDIVWGAPVQSYGDSPRAIALKMNAGGSLQWNTFFGGDPWPLHLPLILKQSYPRFCRDILECADASTNWNRWQRVDRP
jgi:hypothetical protein